MVMSTGYSQRGLEFIFRTPIRAHNHHGGSESPFWGAEIHADVILIYIKYIIDYMFKRKLKKAS